MKRIAAAVAAALGLLVGTAPAAATPAVAEPAPLRIMPLGDSITWGVGSRTDDSYRSSLYRRLTEAGVDVDFVGSQRSGTGPDRDNEGHRGWTIAQLRERVDGWLSTYSPDVILLHIGTNDMYAGVADAPRQLSALLDQIGEARPEAHVFVAQIVGLADLRNVDAQRQRTASYNAATARVVAGKDDRFHLVDQSAVQGIDMWNRLHPNDHGYARMAWNWYRALEPVLNAGAAWPSDGNPNTADVSYRCIRITTLAAQARGCHRWYHRLAQGAVSTRVWQLPVRVRETFPVRVDGETVIRNRWVTRWITGR
jgi:lysophospholipase L1-like esterase